MAVISEERGYLFILAPGTGSTGTAQALVREAGGRWIPPDPVRDEAGQIVIPRKHTTIAELRLYGLADELLSRLFKFSAVRNPFDYYASQWLRLRLRWSEKLDDPKSFVHARPGDADAVQAAMAMDFPQWIQNQLGERAEQRISHYLHPRQLEELDHIMRYETLQEDFDRVLQRLGIADHIEIPRVNVTDERHPDYRTYYDETARRLVEQVFAPYLQDFGYEF